MRSGRVFSAETKNMHRVYFNRYPRVVSLANIFRIEPAVNLALVSLTVRAGKGKLGLQITKQ